MATPSLPAGGHERAAVFPAGSANDSRRLGSLGFVRALLIGLVSALAIASPAQNGNVYTAKGAAPQPWNINANHTLIWNGAPYLPVGLRIDGSPAEVARAKAAGFYDVIVDLPANGMGWDDTIKALESSGMRYLISLSSIAPMADGVAIDPSGYRVADITKPQKLDIQLPGATSALTLVLNERDSSIASSQLLPVANGVLSLDVKAYGELQQVLLIYPHTKSLEQPDLWDSLDAHRDRVLETLRDHPPGPGLRGIDNPLGRLASWTKTSPSFVPTSPYFRYAFAEFLREKYHSVETAMKAWAIGTSDIDSFEGLAKLAPLWSGPTRGVGELWDTDSDRIYSCDRARSLIWNDIEDSIADTAARRYPLFAKAVRSVVDVPLIQEWAGWMPLYETANPAVDGIGMRADGAVPSAYLDTSCRATSSILRWQKAGWLVATEIDPGTGNNAAGQLGNILDDLSSLGARGWFLRSPDPDLLKAMAGQTSRSSDQTLARNSPTPLYYPENACNPAEPQRLPGGRWWLPSPANGNRLDLGDHFFAYRYQDGMQRFTALWTDEPAKRVKLRMVEPKSASFAAIDGTLIDPKVTRNGVEVTVGPVPIVIGGTDEIPVPDPAYADTMAKMDQLSAAADSLLVDIGAEMYVFRDALSGFDRNPGGSFLVMRQQYEKVCQRLAHYTLIEAESSRENNFSEVLQSAGCSNGAMLSLRTQIASPVSGYTADYNVPVRSGTDVEVWMAARIPPDQRKNVSLTVAGQIFTINSDPVSPYGQGFAWYLMGVTKLGGSQTKMHLQINSRTADMAFDEFAFVPGHFIPRGLRMPDPIMFALPKKKGG